MLSKPQINAAFSLDRAAWERPDRLALTYGSQQWTVAQAALVTRQLAQLLVQGGVTSGDRVMIAAHNSPYHFFLYAACARLGAVYVPVSYRLTGFELQQLVDFVAPRVIVCDPQVATRGSFTSTGTLLQFVIDDDVQAGSFSEALHNGFLGLNSAYSVFDGAFFTEGDRPGADILNSRSYPSGLAAIMFTAGTTSAPKAVPLNHEHLWWAALNAREAFGYGNDEVVLVSAPLSHIGAFNVVALDAFTHGGHVVVMRSFDAGAALALIEELRVTAMFGVPTMYTDIVNHPDFSVRDMSSWRYPLIGGAPVPAPMLGVLAFRGLRPIAVWGMTETAGVGTFLPCEHCSVMPGSIGRPVPYIEAAVVEPGSNVPVEQGAVGELAVRGPSVVDGYWHGTTYTRRAVRSGWLLTGDLAQITPEGYLTVMGRKADRIITGGESVLPVEVEDVLRQYPGVTDAAVFGIADDRWGERIAAAIVMEQGAAVPSLAEVQAFVGRILARYKVPRYLVELTEMPLNAAMKVDRKVIAKALWEQLHPGSHEGVAD